MDWNWSAECEETFIKVKEKIIEAPLLIYFNPDKELVLQVDVVKMDWVPPSYRMGSLSNMHREL